LSSRVTSVRVTCGLTIVLSSSNVLGVIGGRHGLNVVNIIRVIGVAVGLVNGVSRVGDSDFVVVILEVRNVGGDSAIRGADNGCGLRSEVLEVDCTVRVTVVCDVTRILLKHRSARESAMQFRRTW